MLVILLCCRLIELPVLNFSSLRIEAMHLSSCVFLDLAWPIKSVILSVPIFGKFSVPIHVISQQPPVMGDSPTLRGPAS